MLRAAALIAACLLGLAVLPAWREGGPVVGVELGNEYILAGPGQGVRFGLRLPGATITLPGAEMDIPSGACFLLDDAHRPARSQGKARTAELRQARLLPVRCVGIAS